MNPIATTGYEQETQPEVIGRLKTAGVDLVIDVRAVASSRRAGFSKTLLAGSLAEAGIGYLHLRDLGTPKAGRQAARAGHYAEMQSIFSEHMQEPQAQLALAQAAELTRDHRACLLCYEHDPAHCHRTIVAELIAEQTGAPVLHL